VEPELQDEEVRPASGDEPSRTLTFSPRSDKYHNFIARISGVGWLGLLRSFSKMDEDDAFALSFIVSVATTVLGPVLAETTLECNTAHGAVFVLFPILLGAHVLAM